MVRMPNTVFKFAIEPAGKEGKVIGQIEQGGNTVPVYGGVIDALDSEETSIHFSPIYIANGRARHISVNPSAFDVPGIYRYRIKEKSGQCDGMTYSDDVYCFDLFVVRYAGRKYCSIEGITVWKEDPAGGLTEKGDEIEFINKYETHHVTLKKQVEGNHGEKNRDFAFTIKVNGQDGEQFNTDYTDGQGKMLVLDSGEEAKVFLAHDETVTIYGLSPKDTYEFEEDSIYLDDGYKTEIDGADEKNGLTASGDVSAGDDTVTYTNRNDVATPTGVVTYYGPYVLLILASGACAVMFLRRRREH